MEGKGKRSCQDLSAVTDVQEFSLCIGHISDIHSWGKSPIKSQKNFPIKSNHFLNDCNQKSRFS